MKKYSIDNLSVDSKEVVLSDNRYQEVEPTDSNVESLFGIIYDYQNRHNSLIEFRHKMINLNSSVEIVRFSGLGNFKVSNSGNFKDAISKINRFHINKLNDNSKDTIIAQTINEYIYDLLYEIDEDMITEKQENVKALELLREQAKQKWEIKFHDVAIDNILYNKFKISKSQADKSQLNICRNRNLKKMRKLSE